MLEQTLLFTGCSSIQFFNSPPFLGHSQSGHSQLLSQKIHFQNCSLKKYIFENYVFKIVFSKNINFIALIYSSSESSEELSNSSIKCLTTFFLMYLHSFKNSLPIIVSILIKSRIRADYC